MSLLPDHKWKLKYTPEDGNLVENFYVPALRCASRYDRSTGFFSATALTLAARGIEGLVRNDGHMRLVVGCTLNEKEVEAIRKGETLRATVEAHLGNMPLQTDHPNEKDALELLAWMVAKGILEVRVAVPCDHKRHPISSNGIFHEKAGIVEDKAGYRLAWNGSLNETVYGWQENWESINVFQSWEMDNSYISVGGLRQTLFCRLPPSPCTGSPLHIRGTQSFHRGLECGQSSDNYCPAYSGRWTKEAMQVSGFSR